ncbi:ribosomal protection-like ABC-F family protein [Dyadobacter luticola]|uniref:ABC-F family ATP-binding cassette domain-containing protein n=1 Tax=Dyadobacter luticola TaxID=1979387 RepID=A0A5R9L3J5_9BACT|nr:ABC-F family ATP-binding cassette domain-containing protein [Dyadobacter luticola]TLV02929.1 ABC-F family ATP-binding cassette domain-containing protein [Dyadobacter luticola]
MLILQDVAYAHPNKDLLFTDISLTVNRHEKIALIGNNGSGKSTLLQILAGTLQPSQGIVRTESAPYFVPQLLGQYDTGSIAAALGVEENLLALREILAGNVTEENLSLLNDDWGIEERCAEALAYWQLDGLNLMQTFGSLSGGQKTKIFLAGILIHKPEIVFLDEPSNHLDDASRRILYQYIQTTTDTLLIVSHDRTLLNLLDSVYELSKRGIRIYGGNYDFYAAQKQVESEALANDLRNKEKALRKAKEIERESIERQQKLDARGRRKQEKAGIPTIMLNTLRNKAERSTANMKEVHAEKVGAISQEMSQLRQELPDTDRMKMDFDHSRLHKGKILVTATDVNFGYGEQMLWENPLSFQLTSGQRLAVKGPNGSGKTTLIRLILGEIQPQTGSIERAEVRSIYMDQNYSLIDGTLTVYEQAQKFNSRDLQEHDIKIRLNRYLFTKAFWDKPCSTLSGGEKMRLMLCSLAIGNQAPDLIILDEPTNNLDIQNIEILTAAINEYRGTLLVISHDSYFLKEINVEESLVL